MLANSVPRRYLRARWVLPVTTDPLEDGCVIIEEGRIVDVVPSGQCVGQSLEDYGEAVISPGFFNLHTHLDYSDLRYFDTDSPFFVWIEKLIGLSWQWDSSQWRQSALRGAQELVLTGTTFAVDASYSGAAAYGLAESGLRGLVGLELFGVVEEKAPAIWQAWLEKYERFVSEAGTPLKEAIQSGRVTITVAPHTPYTVCPSLLASANAWAANKNVTVLLHVAESDMECQWIASSFPPLDKFLSKATGEDVATVAQLAWRGHGRTPMEHLVHHGLLVKGMLAAHAVKLTDRDIELLSGAGASAAHCPRSNSRLRNGIAPFAKLKEAGIHLGFGTDSAASTDDLNVLSEARFAWNLHRAVDPEFNLSAEDALYHLTLGGAKAVGMDQSLGSLNRGKFADLCVFSFNDQPAVALSRPFEMLIYGGSRPVEVLVGGCSLVEHGRIATKED